MLFFLGAVRSPYVDYCMQNSPPPSGSGISSSHRVGVSLFGPTDVRLSADGVCHFARGNSLVSRCPFGLQIEAPHVVWFKEDALRLPRDLPCLTQTWPARRLGCRCGGPGGWWVFFVRVF